MIDTYVFAAAALVISGVVFGVLAVVTLDPPPRAGGPRSWRANDLHIRGSRLVGGDQSPPMSADSAQADKEARRT